MARRIQSSGLKSKVYVPVLMGVFRKKYVAGATRVIFTLEELRIEAQAQGVQVRNIPDLIYRMKSRTELPDEIQALGFRILEITERGVYALAQGAATLISYDPLVEENVVEVEDCTPAAVRSVLPTEFGSIDEQALLSVLRYNNLFSHFLDMPTFHLKSHVRQSVPGVGQAEVDDVHIAIMPGDPDKLAIIPVEAKAKDDPVNRVQIVMQIRYAMHAFPTLTVVPLTVKLFENGLILFMLFNVTLEANDLAPLRHRYYRIVAPKNPPTLGSARRWSPSQQ